MCPSMAQRDIKKLATADDECGTSIGQVPKIESASGSTVEVFQLNLIEHTRNSKSRLKCQQAPED
jgi:hypothetical protein